MDVYGVCGRVRHCRVPGSLLIGSPDETGSLLFAMCCVYGYCGRISEGEMRTMIRYRRSEWILDGG